MNNEWNEGGNIPYDVSQELHAGDTAMQPETDAQGAPEQTDAGGYQSSYAQQPVYGSYTGILKNSFGSVLFLIATIVVTAKLVVGLIGGLVARTAVFTIVSAILNEVGGDEYQDVVNASAGSSIVGMIFGMLPLILTAVAMWLIWNTCRKEENGVPGTAGFTIMSGLTIFYRVIVILSGVIYTIVMLIFSLAAFSEDTGAGVAVLIAVLFGIAIVVLSFIFFMQLGRIYRAGRDVALTGHTDLGVSTYVIVIMILGVVGQVLGLISGAMIAAAIASIFEDELVTAAIASLSAPTFIGGAIMILEAVLEIIVFERFKKDLTTI